MAIPVLYNLLSVRARWKSAVVTILGIGGAVGVFVAMLALANGFRATLIATGSPENAMVRRAGATSEMESAVSLDALRIIETTAGVARGSLGPLVSGEVVVIAAFPLRKTGTDANVQVRGVSERVWEVRQGVRLIQGRFLRPGLNELVVGKNARNAYIGFDLGRPLRFGGGDWTVVGIFDAGGCAFDSEIWADAQVLNQVYKRPENIFQSVTVRLESKEVFQAFKDTLTADPRMNVQVDREIDFWAKQSEVLGRLIGVLGILVAGVMGIGAIFAALNTMYSAVAERAREIATLRAIGFHAGSIVFSFLLESMIIALAGGVFGCLVVLPINGFTTGALNWQTFSHLAFAFRVTPSLLVSGLAFALLMGLLGGTPPALRAARQPVVIALRGL